MIETIQTKFDCVMIIDDNNMDLYISSRMISKSLFGKKVLQYCSAVAALQYLEDHQHESSLLPEIIFVDIYMPIMSGFEFMDSYEKLSCLLKDNCKVFIVSSSLDNLDIESAKSDKNITAFHEKPITKEFLDSIIK